jgi:hypothetical protein
MAEESVTIGTPLDSALAKLRWGANGEFSAYIKPEECRTLLTHIEDLRNPYPRSLREHIGDIERVVVPVEQLAIEYEKIAAAENPLPATVTSTSTCPGPDHYGDHSGVGGCGGFGDECCAQEGLGHPVLAEAQRENFTLPDSPTARAAFLEGIRLAYGFVTDAGQVLTHVHAPGDCEGRGCCIHHPSDHHMKGWPTNWRSGGMFDIKPAHMERICPHGIGHPDPDDLAYLGADAIGTHGCDGCCDPTGGGV